MRFGKLPIGIEAELTQRYTCTGDRLRLDSVWMRKPRKTTATLAATLRALILGSGETVAEVSRNTGIAQPVLHRFLTGERDLTLRSVEKLLNYFNLELRRRPNTTSAPLINEGEQRMTASMTILMPPHGKFTKRERERIGRFDEALHRMIAQNLTISQRMGWSARIIGNRRFILFDRFKIVDSEFAAISDYELFRRMQSAIWG